MQAQKIAVVTGANKGIGFEIARQLSRVPGVLCILACRDPHRGHAASNQLRAEGGNVTFAPLDVGNAASAAAFAAHLRAQYGALDILVNNAAIAFKGSDPTPFAQQARPTLAVNFFGTMELTDQLAPLLRPGATVVNVASSAGAITNYAPHLQAALRDPNLTRATLMNLVNDFVAGAETGTHSQRGWPNSCYGVSKAALIAYTRILARELQPRGITVNAMCPGYCDTDMTSHQGPRPPAQGADTAVYLALLPHGGPTGQFWYDRRIKDWANGERSQ
jgi:carbonyl reductase 1